MAGREGAASATCSRPTVSLRTGAGRAIRSSPIDHGRCGLAGLGMQLRNTPPRRRVGVGDDKHAAPTQIVFADDPTSGTAKAAPACVTRRRGASAGRQIPQSGPRSTNSPHLAALGSKGSIGFAKFDPLVSVCDARATDAGAQTRTTATAMRLQQRASRRRERCENASPLDDPEGGRGLRFLTHLTRVGTNSWGRGLTAVSAPSVPTTAVGSSPPRFWLPGRESRPSFIGRRPGRGTSTGQGAAVGPV